MKKQFINFFAWLMISTACYSSESTMHIHLHNGSKIDIPIISIRTLKFDSLQNTTTFINQVKINKQLAESPALLLENNIYLKITKYSQIDIQMLSLNGRFIKPLYSDLIGPGEYRLPISIKKNNPDYSELFVIQVLKDGIQYKSFLVNNSKGQFND